MFVEYWLHKFYMRQGNKLKKLIRQLLRIKIRSKKRNKIKLRLFRYESHFPEYSTIMTKTSNYYLFAVMTQIY